MPAPTYELIADLSSLVIRPPRIGRNSLLNQESVMAVKVEHEERQKEKGRIKTPEQQIGSSNPL
jgi:hypothetical protein